MSRVLLVDLSSIAHPIWHMSGDNPDPDHVSNATVARVRQIAADHDFVAVCCDSRRNRRKERCPEYKANRDAKPESLFYQIDRAKRLLTADGYALLEADGYEADDCIATATRWLLGLGDASEVEHVTIASADKDLSQLICDPVVSVYSTRTNETIDEAAVIRKFGVHPALIRDWLSLVGDAADGVKGCPGVAAVRATALIKKHGTLANVQKAAMSEQSNDDVGMTPTVRTALRENAAQIDLAYELIGLCSDAPIDCSEILQRREPRPSPAREVRDIDDSPMPREEASVTTTTEQQVNQQTGEVTEVQVQQQVQTDPPKPVAEFGKLLQRPTQFEKQLEPTSPGEAFRMATHMHDSRMFSGYGNPDAVLSTIMLGRELGLGTMGSLRGIHNIKGRHALSADLMVALVLQSDKCEYFEPVELSATKATYRTKRVGREEFRMSFDIEEARQAGLIKGDGNWQKWPLDMCKARCIARLARAVYPDVCFGLYVPEELQ